jgi:hypothetical protein
LYTDVFGIITRIVTGPSSQKLTVVSGNERLIVINVVTEELHVYLENKVGMLLPFGSAAFVMLIGF